MRIHPRASARRNPRGFAQKHEISFRDLRDRGLSDEGARASFLQSHSHAPEKIESKAPACIECRRTPLSISCCSRLRTYGSTCGETPIRQARICASSMSSEELRIFEEKPGAIIPTLLGSSSTT